eukprot:jgi/Chlat1/5867/Chrsp4S06240
MGWSNFLATMSNGKRRKVQSQQADSEHALALLHLLPLLLGAAAFVAGFPAGRAVADVIFSSKFTPPLLPMREVKQPNGLSDLQQQLTLAGIDNDMVDLVNSMSLQEKIGQMTMLDVSMVLAATSTDRAVNGTPTSRFRLVDNVQSVLGSPNYVGSFLNPLLQDSPTVSEWREIMSQAPVVWALDNVHGAGYVQGATILPHQSTLAATFNTTAAYVTGSINAKDSAAAGVKWLFSPQVEPGFHQGWSRYYEHFGEDPFVASRMAVEMLRGMQGSQLSDATSVAATARTFLAWTAPITGRDRWPAAIPEQYVHQYFQRQYRDALAAGVATVMTAYNEVNGLPVMVNPAYSKTLLRDTLGFQGVVISEYREVNNLAFTHHSAADYEDAVRIAMEQSDIDINMVPKDLLFNEYLVSLVNNGTIPEDRITMSAARVLQFKKSLGLFDNAVTPASTEQLLSVGGNDDRNAALDVARESIVLLRNNDVDGSPLLPLNLQEYQSGAKSVLVIGPAANSTTLLANGWTLNFAGPSSEGLLQGVTVLQGVQALLGSGVRVVYYDGCTIDDVCRTPDAIASTAHTVDAVILVLSEPVYAEQPGNLPSLELPYTQRIRLLRPLINAGTPLIVVMVQGRPRLTLGSTDGAQAFMHAGLPGPMGGQAIAEVIFGVINPSGRLPFTYPRDPAVVPFLYFHKRDQTCGADLAPCDTEFEFGTGLSYSTWSYSNLQVTPSLMKVTDFTAGQNVTVSVTVTNEGPYAGQQAVLLFLSLQNRRVAPESKMLKGFTKVNLATGQSSSVQFTISADDLQYWDPNQQTWLLDPTMATVIVDSQSASFNMTGVTAPASLPASSGTTISASLGLSWLLAVALAIASICCL